MGEPKIRAIYKRPDEEPKAIEMENDYKSYAKLLEGLIDCTPLPGIGGVNCFVNDLSLRNGMRPNVVLPEWKEVLCGPILITGYDEETGDSVSLSKEQEERAMDYLSKNEVHHMSLQGAYRYAEAIAPIREAEKEKEAELA